MATKVAPKKANKYAANDGRSQKDYAGNRTGKRGGQTLPAERLAVVEQMLHNCYTHSSIVQVCSRNWGVGIRQVYNYIGKVYRQWERESEKTLVDRVHLRRKQLEQVLEMAMNSDPPDLRVAIAALDRLCRVDGAFAPERVEGTMRHITTVISMTSGEQRKELNELFTRYADFATTKEIEDRKTNGKANGSGLH